MNRDLNNRVGVKHMRSRRTVIVKYVPVSNMKTWTNAEHEGVGWIRHSSQVK